MGRRFILGVSEHPGGPGKGGDHKPIPAGQDLVVLEGVNPLLPRFEELLPDRLREERPPLRQVKDVLSTQLPARLFPVVPFFDR